MSTASRALCITGGLLALVALAPPADAYDAKAFRFSRGETAQPEAVLGPGGARSIRIAVAVDPLPDAGAESQPTRVIEGVVEPDLVATILTGPEGCEEAKIDYVEGEVVCDWGEECLGPLEWVEMCFVTPRGPIQIVSAFFVDGGGEPIGAAIVTPLANAPCGALDCSGAVGSAAFLWPPNHELAPVTIGGISGSGEVTITATGVTSDEAVDARGAGKTCPDASIVDGVAWVRMERSGRGNGRVYEISFTASDEVGATCDGSVTVCVPHDRRGIGCVDDGQTVDALVCLGAFAAPEAAELEVQTPGRAGDRATLDFSVPRAGRVTVTLHDVAGRRVATLDDGERAAGSHRLTWETRGTPAGVYFYRVRMDGAAISRPVVIAR